MTVFCVTLYMVGKAAFYFENHFENGSKFIRMLSFESTSGSFECFSQ